MDFLPSLPVLASYTLAAVALTLTPGPDMTLFLSNAVTSGRAAGLASIAGACTGIVVHSVLAAVGLSALIAASPAAFAALKWLGAAYLAWLAVQALRHGAGLTLDPNHPRRRSMRAAFLKGLWINLLNPKIILFFVSFLPQFVSPSDPNVQGKLFFLGLWFILVALPIVVPMVFAAERVAKLLQGSKLFSRLFSWLFAGVMGAFAIKLLVTRAN
jgi:threonine/homoserine/homoserine lactone efflux protein